MPAYSYNFVRWFVETLNYEKRLVSPIPYREQQNFVNRDAGNLLIRRAQQGIAFTRLACQSRRVNDVDVTPASAN